MAIIVDYWLLPFRLPWVIRRILLSPGPQFALRTQPEKADTDGESVIWNARRRFGLPPLDHHRGAAGRGFFIWHSSLVARCGRSSSPQPSRVYKRTPPMNAALRPTAMPGSGWMSPTISTPSFSCCRSPRPSPAYRWLPTERQSGLWSITRR